MIDLHTHILPGLDDGAQTIEDSLEMARAFVAEGVTSVAATPHVRDDYPTSADSMLQAVDALRAALEGAEIALTLVPGAELAVDALERLPKNELQRLTLAASSRYILVETPYYGWPPELPERILDLRVEGFIPILAHPERNAEVQAAPSLLGPLVQGGTLVQVTAASLDGRLGAGPRETARRLLDGGLAHMLASDAHMPEVREAGLLSAVDALENPALATWLVEDVPHAIVEDEAVPPRPPTAGQTSNPPFGGSF